MSHMAQSEALRITQDTHSLNLLIAEQILANLNFPEFDLEASNTRRGILYSLNKAGYGAHVCLKDIEGGGRRLEEILKAYGTNIDELAKSGLVDGLNSDGKMTDDSTINLKAMFAKDDQVAQLLEQVAALQKQFAIANRSGSRGI